LEKSIEKNRTEKNWKNKNYLRPAVSGCINAGCAAAVAWGCGFGLLTFVLLFANSKRIVWGISGSKRTPCCNFFFVFGL
jgi:hypothetical protein